MIYLKKDFNSRLNQFKYLLILVYKGNGMGKIFLKILVLSSLLVTLGCSKSDSSDANLSKKKTKSINKTNTSSILTIFDEYSSSGIRIGEEISEEVLKILKPLSKVDDNILHKIVAEYNIEKELYCFSFGDTICIKKNDKNIITGLLISKLYGGNPLNPDKSENVFPDFLSFMKPLEKKYGDFVCQGLSPSKIRFKVSKSIDQLTKTGNCKSINKNQNIELHMDTDRFGQDIVALYNLKSKSKLEKIGGKQACYDVNITELNYTNKEKKLIKIMYQYRDKKYLKDTPSTVMIDYPFIQASGLCDKYRNGGISGLNNAYKGYCFCQLGADYGLAGTQGALGVSYEYGTSVLDFDLELAKKWYAEAIKTDSYPPAIFGLGVLYEDQGNRQKAIYWYSQYLKKFNEAKKISHRSLTSFHNRSVDDAQQALVRLSN